MIKKKKALFTKVERDVILRHVTTAVDSSGIYTTNNVYERCLNIMKCIMTVV
uniref:Uncharacterized protein n=1 Tax=Rhizophagus irregularis (strain DAOM 181602 / DAOM 197198 / MUCL 43194) TaxID=747089 RepID=U9TJY9_RHIID